MKSQTLNLNEMGLSLMQNREMQEVEGGVDPITVAIVVGVAVGLASNFFDGFITGFMKTSTSGKSSDDTWGI